jgi:hypothetical protein
LSLKHRKGFCSQQPAADGLKLNFKRIDKEKDRWVNIPRETKEGKPPQGRGKPILRANMSEDGGPCFTTFKEKPLKVW